MSLKGSTTDFPLDVLVRLLAETKKTGELSLRGHRGEGALGFSGGRVVTAVCGGERPIPALGEIFALGDADFEFTPWNEAPPANLEGELADNLRKAEEYRTWMAGVREVIPSDRVRFRLSERAADQGAVTFTSERWRVVLAVNGQRDVLDLASHLQIERDHALSLLSSLVREGVIDTVPAPAEATAAPAAPTVDLSAAPATAPPVAEPAPPEPAGAVEPADAAPQAQPEPAASVAEDWAAAAPEAAPAPEPAAAPEQAPASWPPAEPAAPDSRSAPAEEPPQQWESLTQPVAEWAPTPVEPAPPQWEAPAEPAARQWEPTPVEPPPAQWDTTPAEPAAQQWETPTPAEPAPVWDATEQPAPTTAMDDRLAALFGSAPAAPAEPPPAPPDQWAPTDPRLGGLTAPSAAPPPTAPAPAAEPAAANEWAPPATEQARPAPAKRGLFGLFRREEPSPEPATRTTLVDRGASSRAGLLAAFSNALLTEYNSGHYGKNRVDDRIANLLMRVDEQADPIDRPLPVVDDRLDVQALERVSLPEAQAVPYLALLVSTVYADAEKAFGRDKAKRGYRAAQQHVFGADTSALAGSDIAGKLPKI